MSTLRSESLHKPCSAPFPAHHSSAVTLNLASWLYPVCVHDEGNGEMVRPVSKPLMTAGYKEASSLSHLNAQLVVLSFQELVPQPGYRSWLQDLIQRWHMAVGSSD